MEYASNARKPCEASGKHGNAGACTLVPRVLTNRSKKEGVREGVGGWALRRGQL